MLPKTLRLPVIAAPMFIVSTPALVIAQCKAGVVGAFPALNARGPGTLAAWLDEIAAALAAHDAAHPERPAAPFAVNQIVHRTNDRLEEDIAVCAEKRVPIWITSMGARPDVNDAAHAVGAVVLHDVIHDVHARKAIDKGADGLIAVAAGAGGHTGAQSPFALVAEIRRWFDGPLALSGAIATGAAILAAQALGADYAYVGSAFVATEEANAAADYKRMIVDGGAADILTTSVFSGVPANYLRASVLKHGLDPENLAPRETSVTGTGAIRPWRDIFGAGQGIGAVDAVVPVAALVDRLEREFLAARQRLLR